jgi:uncharacterized protein (TIGR02996 family)
VSERDAFLRKLDEDEDDTLTRLVYADWLDERGEHEEADRQRKWPAAKEWLVCFCAEHNEDPDGWGLSYDQLLDIGQEAVDAADDDGPVVWMSLSNALDLNSRDFWRNWSVVTGVPLPSDIEEKGFRCAC